MMEVAKTGECTKEGYFDGGSPLGVGDADGVATALAVVVCVLEAAEDGDDDGTVDVNEAYADK